MFVVKKPWSVIICSQDENSIEYGIRGLLPIKQIEAMERNTLEEERLARRKGMFTHLSGLIFKDFRDRARENDRPKWCHVFQHDKIFPEKGEDGKIPKWKNWTIYLATDTHPTLPYFSLVLLVDPKDNYWVFGEIIEDGLMETLNTIRVKYKEWDREEEQWYIEPQAAQEDNMTKNSIIDQMAEEGFFGVKQWKKHNTPRIEQIRKNLKYDKERGKPNLMISDQCEQLIWQLKHWCYDPKTYKPVTKDDHLIDCLGGILCGGIEYYPPQAWGSEKRYVPQSASGAY